VEAVAWELADKIEWYTWHYSEMRKALYYLLPQRFKETRSRNIASRLGTRIK